MANFKILFRIPSDCADILKLTLSADLVLPLLEDVGTLPLEGIAWVIVGGESGPGARPMERGWVLSIQAQCEDANVPFFFKQWGGVRKKVHGRTLQGKTHSEFPMRVSNPTLPPIMRKRFAMEIEGSPLVQLAP